MSTVVRERGHAIQVAWRELRKHGEACDVCGDLVVELAQVPDDPRRADHELHPQFCADGRELHGAWVAAKTEWLLDKIQGRREALGFVGLGREEAEVRARAVGLLSAEQFAALLALDPEPRAGQIRALVAAQLHRHVLRDVRIVARSSDDDRLLYRWSCDCGTDAGRDYFSADEARQGWARHSQRPAGVQADLNESTASSERQAETLEGAVNDERSAAREESTVAQERPWARPGGGRKPRTCAQCGQEHQSNGRYCSPECRRLATRAHLEGTE